MKSRLLAIAFAAATLPAAAATYQVSGTVTATDVAGSLPVSTPVTITFTYEPTTAGGDLSDDAGQVGEYESGISDITITFGATNYTSTGGGLVVTNGAGGGTDSFSGRFNGLSPSIGGLNLEFGSFTLSGNGLVWSSDAPPSSLLHSWSSGTFEMTFRDPGDVSGTDLVVSGELATNTLQPVPEPTSTFLIGLAGVALLAHRRR